MKKYKNDSEQRHPGGPIAILGAGIAGLTAANDLHRRGFPVQVFEAGKEIAGLGKSFKDEHGFTYDFGAHLITNRLAAALGVAENCFTVTDYGETVYLAGKTYSFPFGLLRSPKFVLGAARTRLAQRKNGKAQSAADWYRASYGRAMSDEIAIPLIEAWSGVPADELSSAVIPPHVDRGTLNIVKLKLAGRCSGRAVANGFSREKPESPHVWHVYPKGGVAELCHRLAADIDDRIAVESRVEAIHVEDERVRAVSVNGQRKEVSAVVSTAPLHVLPRLVKGTTSLDALLRFRYRPIVLVNLRFQGRPLLPAVTTWVPEREHPFFRLTEVPQSVPWLAPEGMTMVTADIGCETDSDLYTMDDDAIGELCVDHMERMFPSARKRYEGCRVVRTPVGYPVYLREYEADRHALEDGLPIEGLYSVGRNGEFAHILMEDIYWRTLARMGDLRTWYERSAKEHQQ
jgi:protoporphyrinogen oxidase